MTAPHADDAATRAVRDRLTLLGQMGTAVATTGEPRDLLRRIVCLAGASLNGHAHLSVEIRRGAAVDQVCSDPGQCDQFRGDQDDKSDVQALRHLLTVAQTVISCVEHHESDLLAVANYLGCTPTIVAHCVRVPVRVNYQTVGALIVTRTPDNICFAAQDASVLQILADGASAVVVQAATRDELARRTQRLADLKDQRSEQLDSIEERERAVVAEVVHDDPLQLIVAAMMHIDAAAPHPDPAIQHLYEHATDLLEEAGAHLRNLMQVGLTPPDLTKGLLAALSDLASVIFAGTITRVRVDGDDPKMGEQVTETAYKIMREALMNARKHAQAANIHISTASDRAGTSFTVRDDGIGCADPASVEGHFGMATMHTRAHTIGGALITQDGPGRGFTVTLTVPFNGPATSYS